MKLRDLSITKKLWISTLAMLVAMFGAAAWTQRSSNVALTEAMERVQSFENVITLGTQWKGMTETNMQRVIANSITSDPIVAQTFGPKIKQGLAEITKLRESLAELAKSPEDKAAMAQTVQLGTQVLGTLKKVDELKAAGDAQATKAYIDSNVTQSVAAYLGSIDNFIKAQESQREAAKAEAAHTRSRTLVTGLLVMLVVVSASVATMFALSRSIRLPLLRAVEVSKAIAAGDLTQRIETTRGDEFGELMQAMGAMSTRLRELVTQVRTGVDSVATASSEIATGNQDLSARTEQTASNLQQTASSMEQLTGTVSQSADVARQANQLAASAVEAATRGGAVVSEVVHSMTKISDSSKKIADIIGTIDGIAFQTNILALNAAVEAARAGEQGRGFAVVAGEVRSLAQRSAEAAREIKSLIHASVGDVEVGSGLVAQTGQAMTDIVAGVRRVSDLIGEIASAADEQRDGISQVNQAVTNLDQMTQQNAALVEESAAAAQSLREQAGRLTTAVSVFKVSDAAQPVAAMHQAAAPMARPAAAGAARPATVAAPAKADKPKLVSVSPLPKKSPAPVAAAPAAPKPAAATVGDDDDWTSF